MGRREYAARSRILLLCEISSNLKILFGALMTFLNTTLNPHYILHMGISWHLRNLGINVTFHNETSFSHSEQAACFTHKKNNISIKPNS